MSRYIIEWSDNAKIDVGKDKGKFAMGVLVGEIIRCGECKHYEDPDHKIFENCVKWKESHGIILPMKPNDSCSYGSRSGKPNN